ncbi:imidazole glycerol phosphate synthase cyclase subunit [Terasakiella sp. A23]|uniref:imidazole glycerol phosphate synthase subunit HisF n=1 Tax=Terasakiella sp. FCG-A23 TaxID=3080561 RepID=UPI00295452E1|nr:imidazole glycerol phosphate synthase cyclase subunit [Terasakiella sp. A23]MDV7339792.1 imidazole glycerol phosphate synthase cyclase subunit [Terasakiella sp. A23]
MREVPPVRLIARLDIKSENVIKGVHLEGLRVVGKPEDLSQKYYQQGIDEFIFMDAVASLYGRNNLLPIIAKAAENIFVPITVGGGIRSIDDIKEVLRHGADKVAINTQAVLNPGFLRQASEVFGSQCIVLSVEAIRRDNHKWEVMTDNGREKTNRDVLEWIKEAKSLGVGEILLTSIDTEGTQKGFDLDLINAVTDVCDLPIIVSGGAGNVEHVLDLFAKTDSQAVACASVFHYNIYEVAQLKKQLKSSNIEVRV